MTGHEGWRTREYDGRHLFDVLTRDSSNKGEVSATGRSLEKYQFGLAVLNLGRLLDIARRGTMADLEHLTEAP